MKHFRQTLRYMWPYRSRLALGIAAALGVSVLFTVSIGMLVPILQVITSREGLVGWVDRSNVEHRLGVSLPVPDDPTKEDQAVVQAIVMGVKDDSAAAAAGLHRLDNVVALDSEPISNVIDLSHRLGRVATGAQVRLTVQRGSEAGTQTVELIATMPASPWHRRTFARMVAMLPQGAGKGDRIRALAVIMLVLLAMTILRNSLRYANDQLIQGSTMRAMMDLRCETYRHLTALPLSHFGAHGGVNDAISRVMRDTSSIHIGLVTLLGKTIQEPTKAACFLIAALWLQWQVVLVAMIGAPLSYLIVRKFGKQMRKAAKRALVSAARMQGVLEETLFGLRVVKAYTHEGYERRRFFGVHRSLLGEQLRMLRIDSAVSPLLEVLGFVGMSAAILVAAWFVLAAKLDLKVLITQLGLLAAMADSVRKLSNVNNRLQQADAASERLIDLLAAEPEPAGRKLAKVGPLAREIRFRDVSFRYPGTDAEVLKGVSLAASVGQVTAIVGPNGSGKTTLLGLLPRFYDPDGGAIAWDGQDLREVNLRSLRDQIALVTQDAVIFADTVEANIRYGRRRCTRDEVIAAARQAHADEFIRNMPAGYDTVIGEHGTTLSGGQKQRLALARAILRDPSVLILDEAMSQIDAESETKIQQALDEFLVGRTAFIIAHRFSTVRQADQIAVMDAGRVVGLGRHDELMQTCPLYRTLYQTQFREGPSRPAAPQEAS